MAKPKRSSVEIFTEILDYCKSPVRPSKLRRLCNVQYGVLISHCDYLVSNGLLEKGGGVKLSRGSRARVDKRVRYQFVRTVKGERVLALTRGSEVGLLFGYVKWVKERDRPPTTKAKVIK